MIDVVEIRNLEGDKINVRLDINRTNFDRLGEFFAHIRIGDMPYLLVANKVDIGGDAEGREFSLAKSAPDRLPNEFFEEENKGWVMQMITPFLGEKKLKKIQKVLEE